MFFLGIRFKLSLITFLLVTTVICVSSFIVMSIMDTFLLGELVKRGLSMSKGAADAAGYSILARDRLSLDNMVAKTSEHQADIRYAAIVDQDGTITAHSDMRMTGRKFQPAAGEVIARNADGSMVSRVEQAGRVSYEFRTPIRFAAREIGSYHLAIDGAVLISAQQAAQRKVAFASAVIILLSVIGAYVIARRFTIPIQRLTDSVSLLKSGSYQNKIRVTLHDEVGELTRNFNEMAHVILTQQEKLEEYAHGLEESYLSTVKILATSIDARDDYTLQHSTRVAALSLLVGEELGLGADELRELEVAALVHDLGKIRIPDQILKKAGALDKDELHLVKQHPRDGAEILDHSRALHRFIPAVLYHHEWYNGEGYPEGIKGEDIPLFAGIIAIADAYDAITTSRPYHVGRSADTAILEIIRYRGTQFNPRLVDLFVASLAEAEQLPSADDTGGDGMRILVRLITLLLAIAGMAACAGKEKVVVQGGEISSEQQQQAALRRKVAALLEKKNYRRAIELMSDRKRPGSPAAGMEKEYLLAVNGLITAGEEAFSRGDYATAGQSFRSALDFFPVQPALRGRVRQNQPQLRKQLESSANRLLEQGLMEYRNGNLENAIRKWKEIIVFDPGHKEALKAIDTATVQQRALQNMGKPGQ